jgi:hypothetical protein
VTKAVLLDKRDEPLAVPVRGVAVEVLLADGGRMTGRLFLHGAEGAAGQETIPGRLNDPERFFPFERGEPLGGCLLQKGMVAAVATADRLDGRGEPQRVRLKLRGGESLSGLVWVQGPWARARLLDYLNDMAGPFFPLEAGDRTWYVNRDLIQLVTHLGGHGQAR